MKTSEFTFVYKKRSFHLHELVNLHINTSPNVLTVLTAKSSQSMSQLF